jgi:hypothetical protein
VFCSNRGRRGGCGFGLSHFSPADFSQITAAVFFSAPVSGWRQRDNPIPVCARQPVASHRNKKTPLQQKRGGRKTNENENSCEIPPPT